MIFLTGYTSHTDDTDYLRVLISSTSIIGLVKALHSNCGNFSIVKLPNTQGIYVPWKVMCSGCDFEYVINPSRHFREGKDLNMAACYGTVACGFDRETMNRFLCTVGLTNLPDSFHDVYVKEIYEGVKQEVEEKLKENRKTVKALHPSGKIPIKFDGKIVIYLSIRQ